MIRSPFARLAMAVLLVAAGAAAASAGTFVQPNQFGTLTSGTPPNSIAWSAVATGTALPVVTSATNPLNGQPGALVYFDYVTGQIQFDPKGLNVTSFILTYTTATANNVITNTFPGPFQYTTGTGLSSYSGIGGPERTFPAKSPLTTGLEPTTYPARVGLTVGPPLSPLLNTGTNPDSASTDGSSWNLAWAFPPDLVTSGSASSFVQSNFRTFTQSGNANANKLGYGSEKSVFQYTILGVSNTQLGAVVAVPEPSTLVAAGTSAVIAGVLRWRRRRSAE
ncbi:MAG: PEP-CTERM sorting domain-containing protein [Planctomycetes bacterium]|nr:PEP-CTERM sorting domain-containing protein [Planctomycetota bacterium]